MFQNSKKGGLVLPILTNNQNKFLPKPKKTHIFLNHKKLYTT